MEEKSPGLLIQAIPYLGTKKILRIFTPHSGVLSLMAKGKQDFALLTPFCLAEWVYKKGNKDLYTLVDGSLSDALLELRGNYAALCAAGQIAQDLLHVQMPGIFAPEIFSLTCLIFQHVAHFERPETLVAFFRLKWLQQEGLFVPSEGVQSDWAFSQEEQRELQRFATVRRLSELKELRLESALSHKIGLFFQDCARR